MLDLNNSRKFLKPPMRYPGNKYDSLLHIVGRLPYMKTFVDVFGGSASVLLARRPHGLEVYNDRFTGVVDFYRALRNHCDLLVERLTLMLHSREEWERCVRTWQEPNPETVEGLVERGARWYYSVQMAYAGIDRSWMRSIKEVNQTIRQYKKKIELFPTIHLRFQDVQIENLDWFVCMMDYDSPETVFYLDPPYLNQRSEHYKYIVNHEQMLERIFQTQGFVALSGYPTPLYEKYHWTDRIQWKRTNKLANGKDKSSDDVFEVLWIKE